MFVVKCASPLLLLVALAACTTTLGGGAPARSLPEAVSVYEMMSGTKAMALAVTPEGRRTWGVASAQLQSSASKRAIETCEENVARLGLLADCHLLAEGNAPAQATEAACFAGTLPEQRCQAQREFAPGRTNTP